MFFRHYGRERRDVYFRVNPQAIRVQQGNKGSVVDTLGGYFREVMYSDNEQYNGLMLPDLTVECDTGIGYRKELQRLEWIWKNHATPQGDGKPAQTYFMDFVDEDTLWFDGAAGGGNISDEWKDGSIGPGPPINPQASMDRARQFIQRQLPEEVKTGPARTLGGSRFVPRCYEIEILNFAWDESVQDPYRIRFSFRCKVLRDVFFRLNRPPETTGRITVPLSDAWKSSGYSSGGEGNILPNPNSSADYPLNPVGQVATIERTSENLPQEQSSEINPILSLISRATGIGQNRQAEIIQANGGSTQSIDQPLYWRPEFSNSQQLQATQQRIDTTTPTLLQQLAAPAIQTYTQSGPGWVPPVIEGLTAVVAALSISDLTISPQDASIE